MRHNYGCKYHTMGLMFAALVLPTQCNGYGDIYKYHDNLVDDYHSTKLPIPIITNTHCNLAHFLQYFLVFKNSNSIIINSYTFPYF